MPSFKLFSRDADRPTLRQRGADLKATAARLIRRPKLLPAPNSEEARAAYKAACREDAIRSYPIVNGYPDLRRTPLMWWTKGCLGRALETGEISPTEYARLYPQASERELRIRAIEHRLNLHVLHALAFAEDYPHPPSDEAPEDEASDADLLRLGRQFEAARAHEIEACRIANEAQKEAGRQMPARPACLTYSAADHDLNVYGQHTLPEYLNGLEVKVQDVERLRRLMPMTHEVLRPVRKGERSHIDHPGRRFDIVPHPEAQARAEEIITAWDAWRAARDAITARICSEPEALADAAGDTAADLARQVADLPARTAAGFRTKLRALDHYRAGTLLAELPEEPDPDQCLAHSLWLDVMDEAPRGSEAPALEGLSIVDRIDFAAATMDELKALRDTAAIVSDVAGAVAWQGRCETKTGRPNVAGRLMLCLADALTSVETAVDDEAAGRAPTLLEDRRTRLGLMAELTIADGDGYRLAAFARELAAHAATERSA